MTKSNSINVYMTRFYESPFYRAVLEDVIDMSTYRRGFLPITLFVTDSQIKRSVRDTHLYERGGLIECII